MIEYGFYKELDKTFKEAAEVILPALKEHNFTIVNQIDLKEKFRDKLDQEFPQYTILGLCHPQTAYNFLQVESDIGLFFPCNMAVYEKNDKVAVSLIKPTFIMAKLDNPRLLTLAEELEVKLKSLFDSIN